MLTDRNQQADADADRLIPAEKRATDIPLRSGSAIRARQYSIRAALFPKAGPWS
jgi:hypothetical protein